MSSLTSTFKVDLHTHPIPEFYRSALIDAGHETPAAGGVFVDGWRTPDFSIKEYVQERADHGYNYSILSVTAPGVSFLNGNSKSISLARRLNDEMATYIKAYPKQLGAFACLPLPNIEAALEEIKYCIDVLKFDGVGLYTNYDGVYIGHPSLEPVLTELDRRKITVFVHPTNPPVSPQLHNVSLPVLEYPYDTTRAITNLLFTRSQKKFPHIRWIWSHGGGAISFLGARIAIQLTFPWAGSYDYDEAIQDLKAFYYDTAAVFTDAQIAGLVNLVGIDQIVTGSDCPYTPYHLVPKAQSGVANYPDFTNQDREKIGWRNAFKLFPRLQDKFPELR